MPSVCNLGTRKELTVNGSIGDWRYDISGRPAVGAKVCRGPDWKYDDHDTGTDTGVVENC